MALPDKRYTSTEYISDNPTWDIEDSPWKLKNVARLIEGQDLPIKNICEVGCGAGAILAGLKELYPFSDFTGYDISPSAKHLWDIYKNNDINFNVGDFIEINKNHYDLILLLDVIEHLRDPFYFLDEIRNHADYFIFHFPLDLSAVSIFFEKPLLNVRKKVGHIHYYTKNLALALLKESGFDIINWEYTNASMSIPNKTMKTRLANILRKLLYLINKEAGVRLVGGETLLVIARPIHE